MNLLALAAFVWVLGLGGFLLLPYRYGVSWYLAGVARPFGVGVIFVALLREQVWLYSEARARVKDLEQLHEAGRALMTNLVHDAALQGYGRRLLEAATEGDILDDAVDTTRRLLNADSVALFLTGSGGRLRLAGAVGWRTELADTDAAPDFLAGWGLLDYEESLEIEDVVLDRRVAGAGYLVAQGHSLDDHGAGWRSGATGRSAGLLQSGAPPLRR